LRRQRFKPGRDFLQACVHHCVLFSKTQCRTSVRPSRNPASQ
jgi:hypothetical protein